MRTGRNAAASIQPVLCILGQLLFKAEELGDAMEESKKELVKFAMEQSSSLGCRAPLGTGPLIVFVVLGNWPRSVSPVLGMSNPTTVSL